jgi:hypothetical protein
MIVDPGYFRTKFLAGNNRVIPTKYAEYEPVTKALLDAMDAYNGNQPGDPEKAVERILDVVRQEGVAAGRGIPERLMLGPGALAGARKKCLETLELLKQWEDISGSTNFAD